MLSQETCEIRRAEHSDLTQIIHLHRQCFPIAYDAEFYNALLMKDRICLVAATKDHILGVISACINGKTGDLYIMTLCVDRHYRRQGLASTLIQALNVKVRKDIPGIFRIALHVLKDNKGATSLYSKAGFDIVRMDRGHYLIDNHYYDAYLMQIQLQ